MTKPTKPQLAVLRKMRDGWELGLSTSFQAHAWLQKSFETHLVNLNTLYALESRILVKRGPYGFPTQRFILTAKGREAADA